METWNDIRHADILAPTEDSASVPMNDFSDVPSLSTNDEVVDMGTDFDFEGFQVVRREFFAHLHEPSVTFNNYKFYVNCACLNKFPEASFVQVLVNQETKIMALRPCVENARDSFAWCGISKKKRSPRQITCKLFLQNVFTDGLEPGLSIQIAWPVDSRKWRIYDCVRSDRNGSLSASPSRRSEAADCTNAGLSFRMARSIWSSV